MRPIVALPVPRRPSTPLHAALRSILAAVALAACSSSATEPAPSGPDDPGNIPGQIAPEIVGRWSHGSLTSLNVYNAGTGEWLGNAGGLGVMFEFTSDGHYTQAVVIEQRMAGCHTLVQSYEAGTAVTEPGVIRVYPTSGRVKSSDSCNEEYNYDRPVNLAEKQGERYTWELTTSPDGGEPRLMIGVGESTSRSDFRRVP